MEDLREDRDSWSSENCSVARAMDIVGSRSTVLIMREALLGTRRFDDFVRRVGVGEPAMAARLKEMVAANLLERIPYREPGQRTRHEYQLTRKGHELLPVITALRNWATPGPPTTPARPSSPPTTTAASRSARCSAARRATRWRTATSTSPPARV